MIKRKIVAKRKLFLEFKAPCITHLMDEGDVLPLDMEEQEESALDRLVLPVSLDSSDSSEVPDVTPEGEDDINDAMRMLTFDLTFMKKLLFFKEQN